MEGQSSSKALRRDSSAVSALDPAAKWRATCVGKRLLRLQRLRKYSSRKAGLSQAPEFRGDLWWKVVLD